MAETCSTRTVTAELRAEIARQGLTTAAVATRTGIDRTSLTRKLHDQRPFPLGEVAAVAVAIGLPLSELLRRAEQVTAA